MSAPSTTEKPTYVDVKYLAALWDVSVPTARNTTKLPGFPAPLELGKGHAGLPCGAGGQALPPLQTSGGGVTLEGRRIPWTAWLRWPETGRAAVRRGGRCRPRRRA
jgi:hypothetical protein